jgi:hypothetical protein
MADTALQLTVTDDLEIVAWLAEQSHTLFVMFRGTEGYSSIRSTLVGNPSDVEAFLRRALEQVQQARGYKAPQRSGS